MYFAFYDYELRTCPFYARIKYHHIFKVIFFWYGKLKCHSLLSKLPVKIERSEFFGVDNDTQKLRFSKLFTERSYPRRKLMQLKICDHTPNVFFSYVYFKLLK